jgi:hypothetical protein
MQAQRREMGVRVTSAHLHQLERSKKVRAVVLAAAIGLLSPALHAAATFTAITSGPAGNTPYGSTTPYVATVVTSGGTATGTVTFCDTTGGTCSPSGPNSIGSVTLTNASNNVASLVPTVPLSIGAHTIIANYAGDSANAASTSSNSIVTNIQATNTSTSYTLTPSGGPASAPPVTIVFSQPVSDTATVTAQAGGGTPIGTVQFAVDGSNVGGPASLTNGSSSTSLGSSVSVGNHTVSASFTPAAGTGWNASTGNNGGATALVVNAANSVVGSPAVSAGAGTATPTFTIDVTGVAPATANPISGSVTLYDGTPGNVGASTQVGTGNLAGVAPNPNRATIQTSALSLGGHTIWAAFAGNVQFLSGNSAGTSYTYAFPATIAMSFNPNTVVVGGTSLLTITVTNPNAMPLTNVTFSNTVPSGVSLITESAGTCDTLATSGGSTNLDTVAGTISVTAATLAAGQSCNVVLSVRGNSVGSKVDTTSTVTANETTSGAAASATLNVQATQTITFTTTPPTTPMVTGTYTVGATASSGLAVALSIDAGSTTGACNISGNVVSFTGVGACIVDADQAGNTNYVAAPQVKQTITVGKKTTTLTLTATPNPVITDAPVTLVATVVGDPPTGTVNFADNNVPLACSPVSLSVGATSSTATCSATFPTAGTHSITATYSGDGTFAQTTTALAVTIDAPLVPAPVLDRWAMLLLSGLIGLIAFARVRARV